MNEQARSRTDAAAPRDFNPYEPPRDNDDAPPAGPVAGAPAGIAVTYRVTDRDIDAYITFVLARVTRVRFYWRLATLVIAGGVAAYSYIGRPPWAPWHLAAVEGLAVAALLQGLYFYLRAKLRRQARRKRPRPVITAVLTPAGTVVRDEEGSETRMGWAAVPRIEATAAHIFLFQVIEKGRVTAAHVIPRRAFASPAAAEAFLDAARRWHAAARSAPPRSVVDQAAGAGPSLTITYELTGPELRRAHAFYLAQQPGQKQAVWRLAGLCGLVLLTGAALVTSISLDDQASALLVTTTLLAAALFLALVGVVLWSRRYRPASRPGGPVTIAIDPEGYTVRRDGVAEEARTWRGLPGGVGADGEFLVLPRCVLREPKAIMDAYLIPRRAFATPEAAERFLAAARGWHAAARDPADDW